MKRITNLCVWSLLASILVSSLIISCDDASNGNINNSQAGIIDSLNINTKELKNYFLNNDYSAFLNKNDLENNNIVADSIAKESFPSKHIETYIIPIKKYNKLIGKLYVFSKYSGKEYKTIYEDWSKTNTSRTSGTVTVSTGTGDFIATLSIKKVNNKLNTTIMDVANEDSRAVQNESWWHCTTRVYHLAKRACSNDSQCDFLCDLCNLGGGRCTISLAAAAAIVCM